MEQVPASVPPNRDTRSTTARGFLLKPINSLPLGIKARDLRGATSLATELKALSRQPIQH
jgi:hypothetical protein